MGEYRLIRLGEQLREEISQLILRQQIKDPRVSTFLTINHVEIVRDLIDRVNEVYDMLGMSRTPVGAVVGWIYDPADKDIDSYVSFGKYYDPSNPDNIDFVNGRELAILLQFNCDGPIFEKI